MVRQIQVYIFGDQTYDITAKFHDLLQSTDNPILTEFFEQAYRVIRAELGCRESIPRFASIADLLARQREGGLNDAFQTALSCVYQLGSFISQHGKRERSYPLSSDTYLLGLCTGGLAAAAISSCQSLSDLLPAAAQTVLVAFRFGLCIVDVRNRIEPPSSGIPPEWSFGAPGLAPSAVSEALREFSQANRLPPTSQPWISAHSTQNTTISGPPSVLRDLRKSSVFARIKPTKVPVCVPAHAPHLFTTDDVKSILETVTDSTWASYTSSVPVISGTTGKLTRAGNLRSLLEMAVRECLMEPLRWDKIKEEVPLLLRSSGALRIKLTPIATNAEQVICSTLNDLAQSKHWPHSSEDSHAPSIEIDHQGRIDQARAGRRAVDSKIAIIGLSGRFPDAENTEAFWELLHQGLDVVKEVPPIRWDATTHVDVTGQKKNTSATPYGCWLNNAGLFDARFFGMSPKEAPQVDPAQRLALLTAYEAMEQAGLVPNDTPSTRYDRVGIFYGATANDYYETNASQDIDSHYIPGGNRAFVPGRINYCFKFSGPSYSIDTACSSSLAAIHLACNSLWMGDVDTAITGGVNIMTNPDGTAGLDRGFFLSRTGNCKTFDDGADGYCRGEGAATVILKRLEDALADKDPIQAVILGVNTNHSAEAESMTRPHAGAQKALFDKILNATGVDPYDVSYVEMHGTGTQVGDAVEMQSVLETFAPGPGPQGRRNGQKLHLGAAKANVGHGEAVSGVTSLTKTIMMMQRNVIPPHCGIKGQINHTYPTDLEERKVHIALKPTPWNRAEGETRRAIVNNFSAAGGNTALLLEDAPFEICNEVPDPRSSHLVVVSAKCAASLKGNLGSLLHFVSTKRDANFSLPRLSYTTTARRLHHPHRVAVCGSDILEIKAQLDEAIARGDGINRPKSAPKVMFAFTGQGSQYLGMGKQLFEAFSQFRLDIRRYDQLSQSQGFPPFQRIFTAVDGKIGEFTPLVIQLATACMQMALARLWASWGIIPSVVVGHSLGEYAALNTAGVLSDADTIYLIGKRAALLQERCEIGTHSMLAIKASPGVVDNLLCGKEYEISCINGPEDTVVGGSTRQIKTLQTTVSTQGFKSTLLAVPYAFHTSQVDPVLETFKITAQGATFRNPSIPVICPLLGNVVTDGGTFDARYLARHCRETVNIHNALRSAIDTQTITEKTVVIEIGPHSVLSSIVKATLGPHMTVFPTLQRNEDTWPLLTAALSSLYSAGLDIRWRDFHHDFSSSHKVLQLPAYSWDLKDYWIPYQNDWALHKGAPAAFVPQSKPQPVAPKLETTTVHKVVEETTEGHEATIIVESDISRPDLNSIAQGHRVNQIPLCTPSVYADIALSIGRYLLGRYRPDMKERLVDVSDMVVEKALIPHSRGPQILHTSAKVDWVRKIADCVFYPVDEEGRKTADNAWCTIRFKMRSQLQLLQQEAPQYLSGIKRLREGVESGKSMRLSGPAPYKLISTLAQFHPDYRGVDEITLDSETLEASSRMSFAKIKNTGSFHTHPAYIDCFTQTAGFIMNAKDSTDLEVEVFVNHGWKSFQIYESISPEKTYQAYARMVKLEGSIWEGDTVIFDGDGTIAAFFKGIALRGVPRKVFHMVLAAGSSSQTRPNKPSVVAPVVQAQPTAPIVQSWAAESATTSRAPTLPSLAKPDFPVLEAAAVPRFTKKDQITPALQIIAEESGIAIDDLTDDTAFSDIGVDSLLSMVIASRFREELALDLKLDFSLFLDFPTVKKLRELLEDSDEQITMDTTDSMLPTLIQASLPNHFDPLTPTHIDKAPRAVYTTTDVESLAMTASLVMPALQIVSEESGISVTDLTDDCAFSEIGVDSLLSMVIASRFREELNLDLDLEFSMFLQFPTVKDLKRFLTAGTGSDSQPTGEEESHSSETASSGGILTPSKDASSQSTNSEESPCHDLKSRAKDTYCRPATSVILQGFPKTAQKTLFLLPDGGGSSSSYVPIPKLQADVAVIGLNCPYGRDPHNMQCAHDALLDSYVHEIRRRQPHGPYHLGGWSSGGIFAFIATQKLVAQDEDVATLIIMDAPVPKIIDRLPSKFYEFCDSIGLFGRATATCSTGAASCITPAWLIPHFFATVDVLADYRAAPLVVAKKGNGGSEGKRFPRTAIIWACDTVMDEKDAPRFAEQPRDSAKGIHFLVEKRVDFGPCGWDELLPGSEILLDRVEGANHFSMMQKGHIHKVGKFIEKALTA